MEDTAHFTLADPDYISITLFHDEEWSSLSEI